VKDTAGRTADVDDVQHRVPGQRVPPSIGRHPNFGDARTHTNAQTFVLLRGRPWSWLARASLCASHRNKIEVGGWADCVLAATTAAACSAILSRNTNQKESIVDELAEVEVETEESEEDGRVYEWRVEQLSGLGLSHVIASAVASFVDWHEIARLVERGCSPELALEIVR
jgi:hypothetical protein